MKKAIFTLFTITAVVLGSINFTYASTAKATQTTLTNIGNINKIEVHGNVEVIISNGAKDEVTVNNNYYAENAMVQSEDGVLRIASYKAEKLVVYVTATDLRSISAYDNASVKSDGRLSVISLDVNLYNSAYAGLNLDNYAANITVNDIAKADLSGSSIEYNLTYSYSSTVNRTGLVSMNTNETKTLPQPVRKHHAHQTEIASL
jgi:hypothetical protein